MRSLKPEEAGKLVAHRTQTRMWLDIRKCTTVEVKLKCSVKAFVVQRHLYCKQHHVCHNMTQQSANVSASLEHPLISSLAADTLLPAPSNGSAVGMSGEKRAFRGTISMKPEDSTLVKAGIRSSKDVMISNDQTESRSTKRSTSCKILNCLALPESEVASPSSVVCVWYSHGITCYSSCS